MKIQRISELPVILLSHKKRHFFEKSVFVFSSDMLFFSCLSVLMNEVIYQTGCQTGDCGQPRLIV